MDQNKPSLQKQLTLNKKLIKLLDNLLSGDAWEKSLLLKATHKRIEALRSSAQELLDSATTVVEEETEDTKLAVGQKVVYISLYQAHGNNMTQWQSAIKSIVEHAVSRPVYSREEDIVALIRSKEHPECEAYIVVNVKEDDVIPPYLGKAVQDRFGHELLTLRQGAIALQNITEFVHEQRYLCKNGRLSVKA